VIIQRSQLGALTRIGEGGQGVVFGAGAAVAGLVHYDEPVVVKQYHLHKPPRAGAADALVQRADWAQRCDDTTKAELFKAAAWPLAVIKDGAALWGLVMPDMRPRYSAPMVLPSGDTKSVLTCLEHVLKDDAYLLRRFGVPFDTSARARVAESVSQSLAVLHRHGVVASDLSHVNVLVSVRKPYSVTFIDCDSMVFRGREALTVVETPGWWVTSAFGERATSRAADQYKLALAIMRLFARSQSVTGLDDPVNASDPAGGKVRKHVPDPLHAPITRALTEQRRPTAGEWTQLVKSVRGGSITKRWPGPAAKSATTAHGVVSPAPKLKKPPSPPPRPPRAAPPPPPRPRATPRPPPTRPTPPPARPIPTPVVRPATPAWRRWGPAPYIVLAILAFVVIASLPHDSTGGATKGSSSSAGANSQTANAGSPPPPPPAPPPPAGHPTRTSAPARALRRHYQRLDRGEYQAAFALMTPRFRATNRGWASQRASANPSVNVVTVGRARRRGNNAQVYIRFYARDSHDIGPRDDTRCRRFVGSARMVRIGGRWLLDPSPSPYVTTVIDGPLCP
jgi:hypothetical protein